MSMVVKSPLSTFRAISAPAANTQATVTTTAMSSPTQPPNNNFTPWMVVTGIMCSVAGGTLAVSPVQWNLIDGSSGGTNVQATGYLGAGAQLSANAHMGGMNVPIYSGLATLEFAAAGGTSSKEAVTMIGYHVGYGDQ